MASGSNRQMSGNNVHRGNYNTNHGRINMSSGYQNDQNRPMGLPNLASCCYLNSVIQTLFICEDFRLEMNKYFASLENLPKENDDNYSFTRDLVILLKSMKGTSAMEVHRNAEKFSSYFHHSVMGDDINKCYLQILTIVNSAIKNVVPNDVTKESFENKADEQFEKYRKNNAGFIFDLFNGQFLFETKCGNCFKSLKEKYQLFRSMPLQVPKSSTETSIEDCINNFFQTSSIDGYDSKCCGTPKIVSVTECTHVPKYLFFYLVRGSYVVGDSKNNILVKFQEKIDLPTTKDKVSYKLISVIDHFGTNETGHYFAKVRHNCRWWLINDKQATLIPLEDVPSHHTIGLFFKKISFDIDYENDFEKLDEGPIKPIIEALYNCDDIKTALIDYYRTCESRPDAIQNENLKKFGEIMHLLNEDTPNRAQQVIQFLQPKLFDQFEEHERKISIFYLRFLKNNIVSNENKNFLEKSSSNETHQKNISKHLSDLLSFNTYYKNFCLWCKKIFEEDNQTSRIIVLDVESTGSLTDAVKQYFAKTEVDNGLENKVPCCKNQKILQTNLIVNSPKYFFFYINVLPNFENVLLSEKTFTLPTEKGNKLYSILLFIQVIEGRHVVKYPDGRTNIFGDKRISQRTNNNVLEKSIIGVMATLVEDSHDGDNSSMEVQKSVETKTPEKTGRLNDPMLTAFVTFRLIHCETSNKDLCSIIGMLFNCADFRDQLIDYCPIDQRSNIDLTVRSNLTWDDYDLVKDLCKLCCLFEKNLASMTVPTTTIEYVTKYFENKVEGLYLCGIFYYLLDKINSVTKRKITEANISTNGYDRAFFEHKSQNGGFIHDLFYGQILEKEFCTRCKGIVHQEFKPINSLLLDLNMITNKYSLNLEKCLQVYLNDKFNSNNKCTGKCNSRTEIVRVITHSPEYLFICLNRDSKYGGIDKTLVSTNDEINLPMRDKKVPYRLWAVIDQSTHNTLKWGPNKWWSIDDHSVQMIQSNEVVTERSSGFLFKKKIN